MARYRFTPEALADLFEIWSYVASDNIKAADQVELAIYDACAFLAESPESGQTREHLTALKVRFWTVQRFPNYLVVYLPESRPLEIIRVIHGMRDVKCILGGPEKL